MNELEKIAEQLKTTKKKWLVTGCAGFIGSNLSEFLLKNNQDVIGLDNFSTGKPENIEEVKSLVGDKSQNFDFHEGDLRDFETCLRVSKGVDYILHQGALGSVPRSIELPANSHQSNVDGFFNMLLAAKENNVKKFVYASSSSVYGDNPELPKTESKIGEQLSPYAVTKHINELYGKVFFRTYGLPTIGIRYFNVFGKRQDPNGAYAAVIPKWVAKFLRGEDVEIYGDGLTSRDFCYIDNVIQMNIRCAISENEKAFGQIFNCAYNDKTSLNDLYKYIRDALAVSKPELSSLEPIYKDFRKGDIKHSDANISKAKEFLGYSPTHSVRDGLELTIADYVRRLS